jgi:hypothetical protein
MSAKANEVLIDKIAKKHKLDKRVVAHIVRYPFLFTTNVFRDEEDYTPIMLRYVGKFVPRFNVVKSNKHDTQGKDIIQSNTVKESIN